jgi:hypothetical protein
VGLFTVKQASFYRQKISLVMFGDLLLTKQSLFLEAGTGNVFCESIVFRMKYGGL